MTAVRLPSLPSLQRRLPRRLGYSHVTGMIGAMILGVLVIFALFPTVFAPYDPSELVGRPLQAPTPEFRLGTNDIGQDLLSELIAGTRVSISTAFIVATVSVLIGATVGIISGYSNGPISAFLMRIVDLTLVFPFLPLVILLSAYLGSSQRNVIIVLALLLWAAPARFIRSRVLSLSTEPYVEAATAVGADPIRIMSRHIWPGVRTLVVVQFVLIASAAILAEASLSFLGLGDPTVKSWGSMLFFARGSGAFLSDAWRWWVLPTGLMITLAVLGLALVGYSLEERMEPTLRK